MTKFILLYKGPATQVDQMTKEQTDKTMAGWQQWAQKVGSNLVDMGSPMADGKVVVDNDSAGSPTQLNGYSIIQAENMGEALQLVDGHPFLSDKTGEFSVEVFELKPISM